MLGLFKRIGSPARPQLPATGKGVLCQGKLECGVHIRKASARQMVVVLERAYHFSGPLIVVAYASGLAIDATLSMVRGNELCLDVHASHALHGLVPARLSRARDLWKRAVSAA